MTHLILQPYNSMRNIFRDFDIHQCPHCKASVVLPRFGRKSILVSHCRECLELIMIFMNKTYRLDKTSVTSIDVGKLQEHILDIFEEALPPSSLPLPKEAE